MAVLPSAVTATLTPKNPWPDPPLPVSLPPCCDQVVPERVKIQAPPTKSLSSGPPRTSVLPSAERAAANPTALSPVTPAAASLPPCCDQFAPVRVQTQA